MSPKYKITIDHFTDTYEFLVQDNKILRIIKLVGDSGMEREIAYDHVPEVVKQQFDKEFNQD